MPYDAANIQQLMLDITWQCIDVDEWINPRFRTLFPAFDNLAAVYESLGITFCDGLFDIVQASTPPSIGWFLSLPQDLPSKVWGIYVLVLRKGNKYKLYIGSGTSTVNNGVRYRCLQHKGRRVEPLRLSDAKRQGYKQIRCALLAQCDTPVPAHVPAFRTAVVAIEAAFHLIFWPMYTPTTRYNFPDGPWPRDSYTWAGLCTHNPLSEGIIQGVDDLTFTAEQLEHMAAVALQRRRSVKQAWDRKQRQNKTPAYIAFRLKCSRRHQPKAAAREKGYIAAKKFHCTPCEHSFRSKFFLERHCNTDRHKAVVADGCGLFCEPCQYQAKDRNILRRHLSSARHARLAQEAHN